MVNTWMCKCLEYLYLRLEHYRSFKWFILPYIYVFYVYVIRLITQYNAADI